ncbi:hypothetical protein [Algibacter sp. PT7-4]|uniref:hypothetical protein n=1 Tax=Algibacter ulvanivorans TaxID=3400999 RepID=UPI003AABA6FA
MNNYSCTLIVGNISIAETEMMKKSLIKILDSFYCKDYNLEKIISDENKHNYFYETKITFSNLKNIKVQRFTESLIAFCLFWNISIYEN